MARKVKCPICGTLNDKEIAICHNNRYYCKDCYDRMRSEADDYKALIEYICQLYDIKAPTAWITKQIKDYKEQYGYSYRGMKTTLHYFYEILGNDVADSMGIGIVPFVYSDAYNYYVERRKIKESIANVNTDDYDKQVKIINIKKTSSFEDTYKDLSMIDISTI